MDALTRLLTNQAFNSEVRERFYTKIGQLLSNGVNLDAALGQLQLAAARRKMSPLVKLYGSLRGNIANGVNFGQALAGHIPTAEMLMIETGANTGRLLDSMTNAVSMMRQQKKLRRAILGSLTYPALLFCMLILALYLMSSQIIPIFTQILPIEKWTGVSLQMAQLSAFVTDYGALTLVSLIGLFALIFFSLPNWTDRSRLLVENIFPWSIYRLWQGSAFLLAVSSLMAAGVKLDEVSLARIGRKSAPYLRQRIEAIKRHIVAGLNLGEAMARSGYQFPDVEIVDDIKIYSRLRGFDQNLHRITNQWIDDLVLNVTALMKGVNMLMMVLVAVTIGLLITSFYDIFQLISAQK